MLNNSLLATKSTLPSVTAIFAIDCERALDEFWFFMMREEGATKTVEFITHICSEVLYEKNEEIEIECKIYEDLTVFDVKSKLFALKTTSHFTKLNAFLSVEIDEIHVALKSKRNADEMNCLFCNALKDNDPKIKRSVEFFEVESEANNAEYGCQTCAYAIPCDEEYSQLNDELSELEDELFILFEKLRDNANTSLLHPISMKLFVYSKKLMTTIEFLGLSQTLRELSFVIQRLFLYTYNDVKNIVKLCECTADDISQWRKRSFEQNDNQTHILDASLASSLSQIKKMEGRLMHGGTV